MTAIAQASDHLETPESEARSRGELRALLQRNFPSGDPASAGALAQTARLVHVRSGQMVYRQGDEIPLNLILRGYGAFQRTTIEGQQVTVGIGYPGELYGMTSMSTMIANVELRALTDCLVAVWQGKELRDIAAIDPGVALDIIDRLSFFFNVLTEKVDGFLHQDARRRVVRILARHQDLFFAEPPILSRSDLHGLVGTSREMTSRVVRDLEREGAIERVGRAGLRLLRPELIVGDADPALRRTS